MLPSFASHFGILINSVFLKLGEGERANESDAEHEEKSFKENVLKSLIYYFIVVF